MSDWHSQVLAAVERDLRSMRKVPVEAEVRPERGWQLPDARENSEISAFVRACEAVGATPFVLTGLQVDPQTARLLELWKRASDAERNAVIVLLGGAIRDH